MHDETTINAPNRGQFAPGDLALFIDRKGRTYQHTLTDGGSFHSHLGQLTNDQVIGQSVGGWYTTNRGHVLLGIRPTLGDYVRLMPRGPQVIYAKDLGNIVSMADLFPGATVVEAGLGSGSVDHRVAEGGWSKRTGAFLRNQPGSGGQGAGQRSINRA